MASSTGQRALQTVVSNEGHDIHEYDVPKSLLADKKSLSEEISGWSVLKVSKTGTLQPRRVGLSQDRRRLLISSKKLVKSVKGLLSGGSSVVSIGLHWVDRIDRGRYGSPRFLLIEELGNNNKILEQAECVTIHYRSLEKLESLDLVITERNQYRILVDALEDLIILAHHELTTYCPDLQLLQYHWTMLEKEWGQEISSSDWFALCDRLQVPLKRSVLSQLFGSIGTETITIYDAAKLLLKARGLTATDDPFLALWKELVKTDPVPSFRVNQNDDDDDQNNTSVEIIQQEHQTHESISHVAVLSFVRSQQRKYTTTLEQVNSFLEYLHRQTTPDEEFNTTDRLSQFQFVSWLSSDRNDLLDPSVGEYGTDDMTQPLSAYYIQTSHDTFLSSSEGGRPHVYMYTAALYRGVRCLELDVYDSTNEPVVGNAIPLRGVLRAIRNFLNQHPYTFPILLKIENHCSFPFSVQVANQIYEYFGAANLLVKPSEGQPLHANVHLPSPESARGRVILIGKRPRQARVGSTVLNDDLDATNTTLEPVVYDDEEEDQGTVVGFSRSGPVCTHDENALVRSPSELLELAEQEVERASREYEEAVTLRDELLRQVDQHEDLTARLTQEAGLAAEEVKRRAARAAGTAGEHVHGEAEEGVEVHEVLDVNNYRDAYAEAAQESMEATHRVTVQLEKLQNAEHALQRAADDLELSQQHEATAWSDAKRAATEARLHQEHATAARERVEQVKSLVQNSKDQSSSAGTVVQTALMEAKISEKRAAEAQTRAHRARSSAEQDRHRAEEETKKEEQLEKEVTDLQWACDEANESTQALVAKIEKLQATLDRVSKQIKLIENSTQYRKELQESDGDSSEISSVRHGGSFIAKHDAKQEERKAIRTDIYQASSESSAAKTRVQMLKAQLEEKIRAWKAQSNVAALVRRSADRSSHLADELMEQAEEEREAAELRQVARTNAVAAVENRGSQRESVEAQLIEAERAAIEANNVATTGRERAIHLEKEAEKMKDHKAFLEIVALRKREVDAAQKAYTYALEENAKKQAVAQEEKRRLDTTSSVFNSATRDAATEGVRIHVVQIREQEAIVAYNTTIMLRKQAEGAIAKAEACASVSEAKTQAADHARTYKSKRDVMMEIPVNLAKSTMLHTSRFVSWNKSLAASHACAHSFAYPALMELIEKDTGHSNLPSYTKHHMCRVFPVGAHGDPVVPWSFGCQLVSMNFWSPDENLLVADGRFRQNGSCGYTLKPISLTGNTPNSPEHWSCTVLAAYNLPKLGRRMVQPFVRVSLHTGTTSEPVVVHTTRSASANGFNPSWNENNVFNLTVEKPSIAVLAFSVYDKSDAESFVAGSALPVHCLRQGYRSVSLFSSDNSRTGPFCFASLLVKATKR